MSQRCGRQLLRVRQLRIAAVQLTSTDDVDKNLSQIKNILKKISPRKPDVVCLPENSLYFHIREGERKSFNLKESFWSEFIHWAKTHQSVIFFGSLPLRKGSQCYNATIMVDSQKVKAVYKKIHLFDVDIKNAPPVRESDIYKHGLQPKMLTIKGWRLGLSICYDIRFSELYSRYARARADVLLIPSAFLVPTGQAHWHILNRARAIESQAYVVSAAQAGRHKSAWGGQRETYGHTLGVDPWGQVLFDLKKSGPGYCVIDLDRALIESVRQQIPMDLHRRL